MRVEFTTEGGIAQFPGLSRPVTLGDDQLSEQEAQELRRLVEASRFFDQPPTAGAPRPGAADYRTYIITVEDAGRRHTLRIAEPVQDPDLQRLIEFLRNQVRARRQA